MRESVGNAYVFNVVILFIGILIMLMLGTMSYSKVFKVKNRIIGIIEKHKGYTSGAISEIDEQLGTIGYKTNPQGGRNCPDKGGILLNRYNSRYRYCVYEMGSDRGRYYGVITYMSFEFPVIGDFFEFPLYGESKIIYDLGE